MKQMETILDIRDLCVEFKTAEGTVKAVNNLSYTLHKGEKLGIVGESGSGNALHPRPGNFDDFSGTHDLSQSDCQMRKTDRRISEAAPRYG